MENKLTTSEIVKNIGIFLAIIWGVYFIDLLLPFINFREYGIVPRTFSGLSGVFLAPLLHGNFFHLLSNTFPLFVLLFLLFKFYPKKALETCIAITIMGGFLVWLLGRTSIHIGASGLIYGIAVFVVTMGIYSKKFINVVVSLFVIFFYGGLVWGLLPTRNHYISWEGHLFGALSGYIIARYYHYKAKK